MEFNANFKNISVRSCWSLLLMEETGVPGEDNRPAARIEGIYLVIKEKKRRMEMVKDAFEQSCIIEGDIRLYSVLHGVSECVQLILHGVITMLSLTTSLYLILYCALI